MCLNYFECTCSGCNKSARKVQGLIQPGITTVVGVVGLDNISRTLDNLLVKCRALDADGITAYMWTGAGLPVRSVCGSIQRDVCLVDRVLGVGEIQGAGSFCARPTPAQLEALARC